MHQKWALTIRLRLSKGLSISNIWTQGSHYVSGIIRVRVCTCTGMLLTSSVRCWMLDPCFSVRSCATPPGMSRREPCIYTAVSCTRSMVSYTYRTVSYLVQIYIQHIVCCTRGASPRLTPTWGSANERYKSRRRTKAKVLSRGVLQYLRSQ